MALKIPCVLPIHPSFPLQVYVIFKNINVHNQIKMVVSHNQQCVSPYFDTASIILDIIIILGKMILY